MKRFFIFLCFVFCSACVKKEAATPTFTSSRVRWLVSWLPESLNLKSCSHSVCKTIVPLIQTGIALGNGPFTITRFKPGQELILSATDPNSSIATLEILAFRDPATRMQLFVEGDADLVDEIPKTLLGQLATEPGLSMQPRPEISAIVFNPERRPFHLAQVRQAFAHAISREEWAALEHVPHHPATRLLQEPADVPKSAFVSYMPEQARRLFSQWNVSTWFTSVRSEPKPKSLLMNFAAAEDWRPLFENIKAQWARTLGVTTTISDRGAASAELFEFTQKPSSSFLGLEVFSKNTAENPLRGRAQSLAPFFQQVSAAKEDSERLRALAQLEEYLLDKETLVFPLYYKSQAVLKSERLRDLVLTSAGGWNFSAVKLIPSSSESAIK